MLLNWLTRGGMLCYEEDTGANLAGGTSAGDPPPTPQVDTPDIAELQAELERTRKALKEANKDGQKHRQRLTELETADQQRRDAELSEAERLKTQLAELMTKHEQAEAALRMARIKDAARAAAESLKLAFQPGALDDLVTLGAFADLEIGERGQVLDINQAIKDLQKAKPYLFAVAVAAVPADIGATANGRQSAQDTKQAALARNATRWGIKLRE